MLELLQKMAISSPGLRPAALYASIRASTMAPEHGAQHECSSKRPFGNSDGFNNIVQI